MSKNISSKLLLTIIIFCFLNGDAFAIYKHKVVVTEFDDPQSWKNSFSPGKKISNNLEKALIHAGMFQILPSGKISNSMRQKYQKMPDSQESDAPPKNMPKESKMSGKVKSPMKMDKPISMSKSGDEPKRQKMEKFPVPAKKYERSIWKKRKPRPFAAEGSHVKYQRQMDIEPAIHYIDGNPFNNLIQIQAPSMNSMDKMPSKAPLMDDNPIPWSVRLGKVPEKASLFKVKGQVIKFNPGRISAPMASAAKEGIRNVERAELEVMLQLVQNKTGRVIHKQSFRAFSNSGKRPFSEDIDLSSNEESNPEPSSMSLALSFLSKEMASYIQESLFTAALEGEIIAIKNEDVLINIGRQNGVEVGDRFRVFSVGLRLDDPLTANDLGDIYERMGVIQITDSMLGFSKAVITVGKDFMPGNLVQSVKKFNSTNLTFSSGSKISEPEERIPWWDFNGAKAVP